ALVGKIAVEGAHRHARLGGDLGGLRGLEAAPREHPARGRQQRLEGGCCPSLLELALREHVSDVAGIAAKVKVVSLSKLTDWPSAGKNEARFTFDQGRVRPMSKHQALSADIVETPVGRPMTVEHLDCRLDLTYNWGYEKTRQDLRDLYTKAKKSQ